MLRLFFACLLVAAVCAAGVWFVGPYFGEVQDEQPRPDDKPPLSGRPNSTGNSGQSTRGTEGPAPTRGGDDDGPATVRKANGREEGARELRIRDARVMPV